MRASTSTIHRRRSVLAACTLPFVVAALLLSNGSQVGSTRAGTPLGTVVGINGDDGVIAHSASVHHVITSSRIGGPATQTDVVGGAATALDSFHDTRRLTPHGPEHVISEAYGAGKAHEFVRTDVSTGRRETFGYDFARSIHPDAEWTTRGVQSADDIGRYVVIAAVSDVDHFARVFVFDTTTGDWTPWSERGLLTHDAGRPADLRPGGHHTIGADGSYVITQEFRFGFVDTHRFVRWDTLTGAFDHVDHPPEYDFESDIGWAVSDDLKWILFPSSLDDVVEGVPSGTHLYRRHLASGTTEVVPVDHSDLRTSDIHDGGRVVYTARGVVSPSQLFVWDGGDTPARRLGEATEDSPEHASHTIASNADGTRVLFTSSIPSLVDDLPDPAPFARPYVLFMTAATSPPTTTPPRRPTPHLLRTHPPARHRRLPHRSPVHPAARRWSPRPLRLRHST